LKFGKEIKINILLVGGTGFIGSNLFDYLRNKYNVFSSTRNENVMNENYVYVDFNKPDSFKNIFKKIKKIDILIFLIGLAHEKGKKSDKEEFIATNFNTFINLINYIESNQVLPQKLIYISTISVYGEKLKTDIYDENMKPEPTSPYAISKYMTEKYLYENYEGSFWILRLAPVYSDNFILNINRRTKILNMFYRVGSGRYKLSLCNIKNISSCVEGIAKGTVKNGTYNVSDNINYNYKDLLKWQNAFFILPIPTFAVRVIYLFGKLFENNFLVENSIKLTSTNLYPSSKIGIFSVIKYDLNDLSDVV
jgi:nucleoside-diphosphate-sugar epimerase